MNEIATQALNVLKEWNWAEIAKILVAVWAAGMATVALRTWKRQSKAQRHADFLDQLVEAVHSYMSLMSRPVGIAASVKIGMKSHEPTYLGGDQKTKGAIAYIEKRGTEDAKRLFESLEPCRAMVVRIQSLVAKGQVFRFKDYLQCQNGASMLTWQFGRLESLGAMIASPTWNWENPEVLQLLEKVMTIEPEDIRKQLGEHNVAILSFVSRAYERIYG